MVSSKSTAVEHKGHIADFSTRQAPRISHGVSQLPSKSYLAHSYLVSCSSYQSHLVGS